MATLMGEEGEAVDADIRGLEEVARIEFLVPKRAIWFGLMKAILTVAT